MHDVEHNNSNNAVAGTFLFWTDKKAKIIGLTAGCEDEENKFTYPCLNATVEGSAGAVDFKII